MQGQNLHCWLFNSMRLKNIGVMKCFLNCQISGMACPGKILPSFVHMSSFCLKTPLQINYFYQRIFYTILVNYCRIFNPIVIPPECSALYENTASTKAWSGNETGIFTSNGVCCKSRTPYTCCKFIWTNISSTYKFCFCSLDSTSWTPKQEVQSSIDTQCWSKMLYFL